MKHIVFDIDGTLIETATSHYRGLEDMLREKMGREYSMEEIAFSYGIPGIDTLNQLNVPEPEKALKRWQECMEGYQHTVRVFPGIVALLTKLREAGFGLGIVTSKTRWEYNELFLPYGLGEFFPISVAVEDTTEHKPQGEPLQKYAQLAGADMADVIYVGDTIYDFSCANNAGAGFILAGWGAVNPVGARDVADQPEDVMKFI